MDLCSNEDDLKDVIFKLQLEIARLRLRNQPTLSQCWIGLVIPILTIIYILLILGAGIWLVSMEEPLNGYSDATIIWIFITMAFVPIVIGLLWWHGYYKQRITNGQCWKHDSNFCHRSE